MPSPVAYPSTLAFPNLPELELLGTGVREVKVGFVTAKVFATSFYCDKAAAIAALASFKGQPGDKLKSNEDFFQAIVKAPFDKGMVIVFLRDVETSKFVDGITELLGPKLAAVSAPPKLLEEFKALVGSCVLKNTSRIYYGFTQTGLQFTFVPASAGSSLAVPSSAKTSTIDSPLMSLALADVYLGAHAAGSPLRASIAETAAKLL